MGINRVTRKDLVFVALSENELDNCILNARKIYKNIIDRPNLHKRDILERFEDVLLGEIAEFMVKKWLESHGKYAVSTVDKDSPSPDPGHDLIVHSIDDRKIRCSIKSSLSAIKKPEDILSEFKIATTKKEVREINIQVYFWYTIYPEKNENRVTLPTTKQAAIMCWFAKNDLQNDNYDSYEHEERIRPNIALENGRDMASLLKFLK